MKVLFVHQNFPGQYRHLAAALLRRGDEVSAIASHTAPGLEGVRLHRYSLSDSIYRVSDSHPWSRDFEVKCIRGEKVLQLLSQIIQEGYQPDIVIGHPGWGELLAIKDVLPSTPVLHQVEFFYQTTGADAGFDPEFYQEELQARTLIRMKRAPQLLALHDLDWGLTPTQWQASTVPQIYREKLSIIHEGIDTSAAKPQGNVQVSLANAGLTFRPGDEVITFVARNLEPYRGFHIFMRMLPILQALRPGVHAVIVGRDGVSYGALPKGGQSWKAALLKELDGCLDLSRIHFVGAVPNSVLHNLFGVTACHVYLTYPFVLSWSMLEAMACGALLIGSSTPPVAEVIAHQRNGLLVDFFDIDKLAMQIADVLAAPRDYQPLREMARLTVLERFDLRNVCLPRQISLVDQLANGETPDARLSS